VHKSVLVVAAALAACALTSCMSARKCTTADCAGDAQISASLDKWLYDNKAIQPYTITVQAIDGVVYLYGIVDTQLLKNVIEEQAQQTPGVKRVVNSISVRGNVW
jgi:osmotically-inducible protein OsmY